jgi:hypothetical protein
MTVTPKNTICLWYDKDAHDAADLEQKYGVLTTRRQ